MACGLSSYGRERKIITVTERFSPSRFYTLHSTGELGAHQSFLVLLLLFVFSPSSFSPFFGYFLHSLSLFPALTENINPTSPLAEITSDKHLEIRENTEGGTLWNPRGRRFHPVPSYSRKLFAYIRTYNTRIYDLDCSAKSTSNRVPVSNTQSYYISRVLLFRSGFSFINFPFFLTFPLYFSQDRVLSR